VDQTHLPLKLRLLYSAAWTARAVMLAFVMAAQGQLMRHLRIVPCVVRTNAALGHEAFGLGPMVNHWISYWHLASVTRQISGTEFGNVPEVRERVQAKAIPLG
jgi:hypothetical protein